MRIISSNINWENAPIVELRDENNELIVIFEDKSSVLGNKICVYSAEDKPIWFLDEDMTEGFDAFNIQKENSTMATVKRTTHFVHRDIKIESRGNKYSFQALQGTLQYDGEKAAKILKKAEGNAMKIELYKEEDTEYLLTLLYAIQLLLTR